MPLYCNSISHFLRLASATSGPNRNRQTKMLHLVSWQTRKASPYLVFVESDQTLVSIVCWRKYVGRIRGSLHPVIKPGKLEGKCSSFKGPSSVPWPSKAFITYYPKELGFSLLLKGLGICRPIFWPLFSVTDYTSLDKGHWLPYSASSSSEETIVLTAFWSHRVRRSDPTQCVAHSKHSIINLYCCLL